MAVLPTMTTSKMSVERRPGPLHGLAGQAVDLGDHRPLQLGQAVLVVDDVVQPGDDVVAEGHLRVHGRLGGEHLAALQVGEVGGDGGGAHVDGQARAPAASRRPARTSTIVRPCHTTATRSQPALRHDAGQRLQHREVEVEVAQSVLLLEAGQQPLGVGRGFLQSGGLRASRGRP